MTLYKKFATNVFDDQTDSNNTLAWKKINIVDVLCRNKQRMLIVNIKENRLTNKKVIR